MLEFDIKIRVGNFELKASGRQTRPRMGLFGPSGSGKTTLLNCLAGLLRPVSGYIKIGERTVFDASTKRHVPPHKRSIGYVFQEGRLFPHMTVGANIEYGRTKNGRGPSPTKLYDVLDLNDLLERSPETLSGGERQRVALARALAAGPELLLLDEPLASVDGEAKLRIMPYLIRTYELWGTPFVYVTHSLTEIIYIAETTWLMSEGEIIKSVRPLDLLGRVPEIGPLTNILVGTVEKLPVQTGYAVVSCNGSKLKVPNEGFRIGDRVTIAIPANDVMLMLGKPRGVSARNVLPATVQRLEQNGHSLWAVTETGSNEFVVELTEDAGRELELKPGTTVNLAFKSHSVSVAPVGKGVNDGG